MEVPNNHEDINYHIRIQDSLISGLKKLLNENKFLLIKYVLRGLISEISEELLIAEILEIKAKAEYARSEYSESFRTYDSLLSKFPDNYEASCDYSKLLWNRARIEDALSIISGILEIYPKAQNIYAEMLYSLKNYEILNSLSLNFPDNLYIRRLKDKLLLEKISEYLHKREYESEDKYLITAIISVYNSERFIRGCLEDLVAQSIFEKIEVLIINSNSGQNEEKIIREFQSKYPNIKYIRTENTETLYKAWERGCKLSKGKYISNANTDDRHSADFFEVMSNILENNPEFSLIYADVLLTEQENESFNNNSASSIINFPDWSRIQLLTDQCFIGPQPLWRKDIHDEYLYFDPDFISSGDYEFWLRVSQTRQFYHLPEVKGLYLYSAEGIQQKNKNNELIENGKIINEYMKSLENGQIIKNTYNLKNFDLIKDDFTDEDENYYLFENLSLDYKFNPARKIIEGNYFILINKLESHKLSEEIADSINKKADQVWVPSQHSKNLFLESGVFKQKIHIIPCPSDIDKYNINNSLRVPVSFNYENRVFQFAYIGSIQKNKGIDILIEAFREEFSPEEQVRLFIKDNLFELNQERDELLHFISLCKANISIDTEVFSDEVTESIFKNSDCIVYPFIIEGSGYFISKVFLSGIPLISSDLNEICPYFDTGHYWKIETETVNNSKIPSKESIKKLMRQIFNNYQDCLNKTLPARDIAKMNYSSMATEKMIINSLRYLKQNEPLSKNDHSYYFFAGLDAFEKSEYPRAIENFAIALKKGLANSEIFMAMANALRKIGQEKVASAYEMKAADLMNK